MYEADVQRRRMDDWRWAVAIGELESCSCGHILLAAGKARNVNRLVPEVGILKVKGVDPEGMDRVAGAEARHSRASVKHKWDGAFPASATPFNVHMHVDHR